MKLFSFTDGKNRPLHIGIFARPIHHNLLIIYSYAKILKLWQILSLFSQLLTDTSPTLLRK